MVRDALPVIQTKERPGASRRSPVPGSQWRTPSGCEMWAVRSFLGVGAPIPSQRKTNDAAHRRMPMTGPDSLALTVHAPREEQASSDDELVRAALAEPKAFGLVYERYYDRVYRYCRSRSPNHDEAADLAQQVFVRALDNLHHFRPRGSTFAGWLFRIAHNLVVDAGRRRRHPTIPWDSLPELAIPPTPDVGPEEAALRAEQLERLRQVVNALRPDRRELLLLRFGVGLSIAEIATVIGQSVSATQMRLVRTIAAVRKDY